MEAQILDGKPVAEMIKREVSATISKLDNSPELTVILCTDNPASELYVKNKIKLCLEVGIKGKIIKPFKDREINHDYLVEIVNNENRSETNGILIQLPLPLGMNKNYILDSIDPMKDVDCFTVTNVGLLCQDRPRFTPCTPSGILRILHYYRHDIIGKKICIINRSDVVGKPMFASLIRDFEMGNGTVSICHDKTPHNILKETCHWADIIIVAVGKRNFLTADMVTDKSIIIDVGINRDENNKVCGDCDFNALKYKVKALSPVPGGVGLTTTAMLMYNTVHAYSMQEKCNYLHDFNCFSFM